MLFPLARKEVYALTIKSRVVPYEGTVGGYLRQVVTESSQGGKISDTTTRDGNVPNFSSFRGSQVTDSEGHSGWRALSKGQSSGDVGGPFTTTKKWVQASKLEPVTLGGGKLDLQLFRRYVVTYVGPVLPIAPVSMVFPPSAADSDNSLMQLGTTAIARCSPSNPTADTSVFLKELLSEGIPHLFLGTMKSLAGMGAQTRRKALGDGYLNFEFGWKPFVSDLKQSAEAIAKADEIMRQFERDSGKVVRRKYFFRDFDETTSNEVKSNCSPWYNPSNSLLIDNNLINKGKVIRTERTYRKTWFSGAFQYYVPSEYRFSKRDGIAYAVIQARKVHGLSLTPDVIWNSMPWSWLVDWFSNTSEVLQNLTDWAIDNQVMRYGYIMQHTRHEYTYTFVGETGFQTRDVVVPSVTLVTETKVRRRATPYGFGLDIGSFSNRQKAIVAALGLSRGK